MQTLKDLIETRNTKISTDVMFAAAVAAHEKNGGYLKFPRLGDTGELMLSNKQLMMKIIQDGGYTPAHLAHAQKIREHFQQLIFQKLSGDELNSFQESCLRVSTQDELSSTAWLDQGLIASMPAAYQRNLHYENQRNRRAELAEKSQPVGTPGQVLNLRLEIQQCNWSRKYSCWTHNALQAGNLFLFFYSKQLEVGDIVELKATVKCHRDHDSFSTGQVTFLHRIKIQKIVKKVVD